MAAVQTRCRTRAQPRRDRRRAGHHADLPGADLLDHLDGRSSRATSPTTIPPTVLFEPEISPFVKLFTKRSQLREPPTPGRICRRALVGAAWCSTAARRSCAAGNAAKSSCPAIRTAS